MNANAWCVKNDLISTCKCKGTLIRNLSAIAPFDVKIYPWYCCSICGRIINSIFTATPFEITAGGIYHI